MRNALFMFFLLLVFAYRTVSYFLSLSSPSYSNKFRYISVRVRSYGKFFTLPVRNKLHLIIRSCVAQSLQSWHIPADVVVVFVADVAVEVVVAT